MFFQNFHSNYSVPDTPSSQINGKCLVYAEDNFDGRIKLSDLHPTTYITSASCSSFCHNAIISDCHYAFNGTCRYQLTLNANQSATYDCVISNTGMIVSL